jgi:ABC-type glycerol-3-phosphate transport system permease component
VPIIARIGRKDPKVIALISALYVALIIGAITMVYPFLLMIAGSTKSNVDEKEFTVRPGFMTDHNKLYQKHVEGMFNERLDIMRAIYDIEVSGFDKLPAAPSNKFQVMDWEEFLAYGTLPDYSYTLGYMHTPLSRTNAESLRAFKKRMIQQYGTITEMNLALDTEFVNWNAFEVLPEYYLPRRNQYLTSPWYKSIQAFKATQPINMRYYFNAEGFYKHHFLQSLYTRDITAYNAQHDTTYASWDEIHLSRRRPTGTAKEQEDWENFVRRMLNLLWVRVEPEATPAYQEFLLRKYQHIDVVNRNYQTSYERFTDIALFDEPPTEGVALSDWDSFLAGWTDPETGTTHLPDATHLRVHSVEFMFRDAVLAQHSLDELNESWSTHYTSPLEIKPPQQDLHRQLPGGSGAMQNEFTTRNYKTVLDYMVLHGRGIFNTAIYCLLAVLTALIVNPMAAYALSRYRLPNTYKLLLFMLLTMAFPPMVTQIPVFLMLRDFNMLNTFAALILPGMAHGYSIFLLKGFFDSLPGELYESAQMDGAGEWTMFWTITMSLSKPILAVIALSAFTAAYSNFMFALLICQSEKMWTLMVWLFQLQQRSGQGVMYASLIIAAIPTFIIFVFCQNIIMRGIVVPVEK